MTVADLHKLLEGQPLDAKVYVPDDTGQKFCPATAVESVQRMDDHPLKKVYIY